MIYQRLYDKFINGGGSVRSDFLYIKDMYSNMLAEAFPLQLACDRFVCFGAGFIYMSCFGSKIHTATIRVANWLSVSL